MARFILSPFGSAGDVHPFLWIGKTLRACGHEVTLITAWHFEEAARRAGLSFRGVGERDLYERLVRDPDLWHWRKGTELVFQHASRSTVPYFEAICAAAGGRDAVIVAPAFAFGARLARERLGLPLATVHLQPACFLSLHDTPVFATGLGWIRHLPRSLKRLLFALSNPLDRLALPALGEACAQNGVPPPPRIMPGWWHSLDLVLALFPGWFAAPQPDWPPQTRMIGFPLYDPGDQLALPAEIEAFLAAGPAPILFTPGSAMAHGHAFFATAAEACRRLGCRALFVTRHPEQLPAARSAAILHCDYAPFSRVLPRCAAAVHHGGIGTLSQALAAGVPQLVMPMAHDQPDNAHRLRRLGAGRLLSPGQFTGARVARELGALLDDPAVSAACRDAAGRLRQADPAAGLIAALETLPSRHSVSHAA